MAIKSKKRGGGGQTKKKISAKSRRKKTKGSPQTEAPFEQDLNRRIGQHEGAGKPPLMKK
jgi:hypothetical protein